MKKNIITFAGLLVLSLLTATTAQSRVGGGGDFGRTYGANGYIPNMPLYFGQHGKKHKKQAKCTRCRVCPKRSERVANR